MKESLGRQHEAEETEVEGKQERERGKGRQDKAGRMLEEHDMYPIEGYDRWRRRTKEKKLYSGPSESNRLFLDLRLHRHCR